MPVNDQIEIPEEVLALRPQNLEGFVGQREIRARMSVLVGAARKEARPAPHMLFSGPAGLGKTTLASLVAEEMGSTRRTLHAPAIEKPRDLVVALSLLEENDVLFIDEIHRLQTQAEEYLYTAMEDFRLNLLTGDERGLSGEYVTINLAPFTLVAATTRRGMLSTPLIDRFSHKFTLEHYPADELAQVVLRAAPALGVRMGEEAAVTLGAASRGTPRIALAHLGLVRDYAIEHGREITPELCREALRFFDISADGLSELDLRYLRTLEGRFGGGPAGVAAIAAALDESADTLEATVEPYLLRRGLIDRTSRGRVLRGEAWVALQEGAR